MTEEGREWLDKLKQQGYKEDKGSERKDNIARTILAFFSIVALLAILVFVQRLMPTDKTMVDAANKPTLEQLQSRERLLAQYKAMVNEELKARDAAREAGKKYVPSKERAEELRETRTVLKSLGMDP